MYFRNRHLDLNPIPNLNIHLLPVVFVFGILLFKLKLSLFFSDSVIIIGFITFWFPTVLFKVPISFPIQMKSTTNQNHNDYSTFLLNLSSRVIKFE